MNADPQQALQLRDIHLPPPPPLWPPAPGWWVLAALLLVLLAWAARLAWKRHRRQRERQQVFDALARLEDGLVAEPTPEALARISALLRRLALGRFPREQVAELTGDAWLAFLDRSGGKGRFVNGPGRALASGPYQRTLPSDFDPAGLSALVREWVDTPPPEHRMNFQLAWPWLLAALPLPLLAWRLLPAAAAAPVASLRFPFFDAVAATADRGAGPRSRARIAVAALAWLLLVVAAARPQQVGETIRLPVTGRSLMLAVDLSGSMQTPDMGHAGGAVSRLAAVKAVAGDFIQRRVGDRLGLILFGDRAYLQAPLTLDRSTVKTLLDEAQIGLAGQQTAIGDAIGLAIKRLRAEPAGNRVLILLTDGASNAGTVEPLKAAALAAQEGVRIYTIGVGAEEETLPGPFGGMQSVPSDLDEGALKTIAQTTGGRYFRASDVASLAGIYGELDRIEPRSTQEETWRPVEELYLWPLAAALLLSVLVALSAAGLAPRLGARPASRSTEARHA